MGKMHFATALLAGGWRDDVLVEVDGGVIARVTAGVPAGDAARFAGPAVPGLPNVHSHSFQRGMAGLAERRGSAPDSFWTWREVMYRFLDRLTPDDIEAIAAHAFAEMLEAGFTAVGEFHYLHHAPDGSPYANLAETAERIAAAADIAGIGLTLLPVLYAHGNFGGAPPVPGQRRFLNDPDRFARLMEGSRAAIRGLPDARIGIAPHSLRAVTLDELRAAVAANPAGPVHIHVAEQVKEVDDCLAAHGRRPIELLFDTAAVDPRWCLIHATHADAGEIAAMAGSGAVIGFCPLTEASLGDGICDVTGYVGQGGRFAIGSDSLIRVSAAEELRTLEHVQRLRHRSRNTLGAPGVSTGRRVHEAACAGGAQALDRNIGRIAPGARADIVVLDPDHPSLAAAAGDVILDAWIFSADNAGVADVICDGVHVVAQGRHRDRERLAGRYRAAVRRLEAI
ncbi:formimidoylglutamate deiminase [Salinarimonas soli]|uniref:Formimidoylglutamate deiminase n=1 Tax=Salinarimonas soli TaxID=1638099 RepID=A0A5B2W143_9HYPH|nr:formimidoylglutamate deiminase [Salinarimonas soli]KAA2244382.1 formimidoylglutamate deiminase [Salinarimonas soli]